jgi:hypothetical protein
VVIRACLCPCLCLSYLFCNPIPILRKLPSRAIPCSPSPTDSDVTGTGTGLVFVQHNNPPSLLLSFWHAASTIAIGHPNHNLHAHVQVPSPPVISLTSIFLAAALALTAWSLILTLTLTLDPCATCCPLFPRTTLLHLTCKSQKPWSPLCSPLRSSRALQNPLSCTLSPTCPLDPHTLTLAHSPSTVDPSFLPGLVAPDSTPLDGLLACFSLPAIHYSPKNLPSSTYNPHLSSFLHPSSRPLPAYLEIIQKELGILRSWAVIGFLFVVGLRVGKRRPPHSPEHGSPREIKFSLIQRDHNQQQALSPKCRLCFSITNWTHCRVHPSYRSFLYAVRLISGPVA